ncbi:hypothetical protein SAY87_023676 [Trapa incisa]|uniref:Uncharacterized protein n=1 Tax=Trapa incisa TaxID=236973 RepID=A0AAN7QU24_9MYRT|nr:hypothetical protein SAY87_023676 [Trapa incisa]
MASLARPTFLLPLESTPPLEQTSLSSSFSVEDVDTVSAPDDQTANNTTSSRPKKPAWNKPPLNEGTAPAADARLLISPLALAVKVIVQICLKSRTC